MAGLSNGVKGFREDNIEKGHFCLTLYPLFSPLLYGFLDEERNPPLLERVLFYRELFSPRSGMGSEKDIPFESKGVGPTLSIKIG